MKVGGVDGRRARWADHRQARRSELIAAATRAIRRHGAAVAMDDIAASAGTSKTVFYRYFADKADLYLAVSRRAADSLVAQVSGAMTAAAGPREAVVAGIDAYLRHIEAEPSLYRFVVEHPRLDLPADADPVATYSGRLAAYATRALEHWLRERGLDPAPARAFGHGAVGFVRAAADDWLGRPGATTRAQLTGQLTELLWNGLAGVSGGTEVGT